MAGNTIGQVFRITTFGESHGPGIGVVIDGCPSDLLIEPKKIQQMLDRRRPGQSKIVTQRKERDAVEILSGVIQNRTTGAPIALWIANHDARPADYAHVEKTFRPSHADFTYDKKYKVRDHRGGGRSSARETAARVAAGAIALQVLEIYGIAIHAFVSQVGPVRLDIPYQQLNLSPAAIDASPVRCPDPTTAAGMEAYIESMRDSGDTTGGTITCVIKHCPAGLGEPVFDKLHADLGKAILSINACKGFEYGSGFEGVRMKGSAHNDQFVTEDGAVRTKTNFSGGIQGGISNGMDIYFRCAFKPVSTIMQDQDSVDKEGRKVTIAGKGRHDPCVVPRAVPIVEAMAAVVLLDHLLRNRVYHSSQ